MPLKLRLLDDYILTVLDSGETGLAATALLKFCLATTPECHLESCPAQGPELENAE